MHLDHAVISLALLSAAWAAPEICNGADDDADGQIDEGPVAWAPDADLDGHGDASAIELLPDCTGVSGDVSDCDDGDAAVHPGRAEACDGVDEDCDGVFDEGACPCDVEASGEDAWMVCLTPLLTWDEATAECRELGWQLPSIASADEQDALYDVVAPYDDVFWIGLTDVATEGSWVWSDGTSATYTHWRYGEPNDSGTAGEDCAEIEPAGEWDDQRCTDLQPWVCERACTLRDFFADADGDGLGDPGASERACAAPPGTVANDADCDDATSGEPGLWYVDDDGDGVGAEPVVGCGPAGAVELGGDCDDGDATVHPGAVETPEDGFDSDCDGIDGTLPPDLDSDGDGILNGDEELVDRDGDGLIDPLDPDDDGDGIDTAVEGTGDLDGDGVPNHHDLDSDGDGAADAAEGYPKSLDAGGGGVSTAQPTPDDPGCGCNGTGSGSALPLLALLLARRRERRFR